MSFVFKQIDAAYKTSTPFYAHKRWTVGAVSIADLTNDPPDTVGGEISMSIYYGKYTQSYFIGPEYEERTTLDEFTRNIWNSTNHLYLENFQGRPYEKYKQGHIGVETRNVTDVVQVFSIPQKIIGSGIKPGSFRLSDGTYTFFDDGNGNILGYNEGWSPSKIKSSVYNTGSRDFYYCSFLFNETYKYRTSRGNFKVRSHGNLGATVPWNLDPNKGIAGPTHGPAYLTGDVVNGKRIPGYTGPGSKSHMYFQYDHSVTGSSYVRIPHTDKLNFNGGDNFSISFWFDGSPMGGTSQNSTLIAKNGRRKVLKRRMNASQTNDYSDYIDDEIYVGPYPFSIEYINSNDIKFSVSDGAQTPSVSKTVGSGAGGIQITCVKTGSSLFIYENGPGSFVTAPCECLSTTANDADIFIGAQGNLISDVIPKDPVGLPLPGTGQFFGIIGPIHFFNRGLNPVEIQGLYDDIYNNHYGSILYDQGQIIWTNTHGSFGSNFAQGKSCDFNAMQFRSSKLITTNEFICAVGPGELNMTTNPSILVNSVSNCNSRGDTMQGPNEGGECLSFVTGSDFSPYVTGVGLYNDRGDLLVFGKLATPIKKATNCDTIFIVKWDES